MPSWAWHDESTGSAMIDQDKGKQELIEELAELRRRVAVLEASLTEQQEKSESSQQTVARWRSIAANMPVFLCFVDRAGTIQYLKSPCPWTYLGRYHWKNRFTTSWNLAIGWLEGNA